MSDKADFTRYSENDFNEIVEILFTSGTNMIVGNCNYLTHRILTEDLALDILIIDCGYDKLVPMNTRKKILEYIIKEK